LDRLRSSLGEESQRLKQELETMKATLNNSTAVNDIIIILISLGKKEKDFSEVFLIPLFILRLFLFHVGYG